MPKSLLFVLLFSACSASHVDTPIVGASVLTEFAPESVTEMEIAMRPFSHAAWRVHLKRTSDTEWKLTDPQGSSDLANGPLIEHFLKVLMTFTTEAKPGDGTDEIFGFTPYRAEIRIKSKKETLLLLGNPSGNTGIFFRREAKAPTFIGRGALLAFLGHIQTASAFHHPSPFLGTYEDYTHIELEKNEGKEKGRWIFNREGGHWRGDEGKVLAPEKAALIEKILRQRILNVENPTTPPTFTGKPDWTLRITSTKATIPPQEVGVFFVLDQVFASNHQRKNTPLELYPEFAGALRLFTQAGFTRVKSGIK